MKVLLWFSLMSISIVISFAANLNQWLSFLLAFGMVGVGFTFYDIIEDSKKK